VDDVSFIKALLDDLAQDFRLDAQRVCVTGMSNGAIMAYRLASELSDRIAAIAPVAGTMATETCEPKRQVPVIRFHGTMDEFVPIAGGIGKKSPSTLDAERKWMTFAVRSTKNSTSSTKRKRRLVASAWM
jgi:polyhydroxybutyrate depolymerase